MNKLLLTIFILSQMALGVLACNRGGPMGFAHKDPGMLSVNITFSPTFAFASTSGTSGCKNWDYSIELRREFIQTQWVLLREESSRGGGEHIAVLSNMSGCLKAEHREFSRMLKQHYPDLFAKRSNSESQQWDRFLQQVDVLVKENVKLSCSS